MLGSVRYGAVLFAAHIAASLLMGIGQRVWMGRHPVVDRVPMEARRPAPPPPPRIKKKTSLSVHCQLAATLHEHKLLDRNFFISRLLHGLLAGGLSLLLFRFVPLPLDVFSPMQDARITPFTTSAAASVALLLMCAMLLLTGKGPARLGRKG